MAALEYLTNNRLIAYPFKDGASTGILNPDWFLDMLLAPKDRLVRRIYLSRLAYAAGTLTITFSDAEKPADVLAVIPVGIADVVSHYVSDTAFFGYTGAQLSAKLVFGPSLREACLAGSFDYTFLPADAELSSGVVVLAAPLVKSLGFAAMNADDTYHVVKTFLTGDATPPSIANRYNTNLTLEPPSGIGWYVGRARGAGLYDNCPDTSEYVFSISGVKPDALGNVTLITSSCYALELLTADRFDALQADLNQPLAPYIPLRLYPSPATYPADEIIGHSLLLSNSCKPKCGPEAMGATAHYLNRLNDGFMDIVAYVSHPSETCGIADTLPTTTRFVATSFCDEAAFTADWRRRKADGSLIPCSPGFQKNFHEGHSLWLRRDAHTVDKYTIVEWVSSNEVILDRVPTITGLTAPLDFKVDDFGVGDNFLYEVTRYNDVTIPSNSLPLTKVVTSSSEAYAEDGNYSTFFSISVGVYNPGSAAVAYNVSFAPTAPAVLVDGSLKVRTSEHVLFGENSGVLDCRSYAYVEAVFSHACGSGQLISVDITTELGTATYTSTHTVDVTPCPASIGGGSGVTTVVFESGVDTKYKITSALDGYLLRLRGTLPPWIAFNPDASAAYNFWGRYTGATNQYTLIDVDAISVMEYIMGSAVSSTPTKPVRFKLESVGVLAIVYPAEGSILRATLGQVYTEAAPLAKVLTEGGELQLSASLPAGSGLSLTAGGAIIGTVTTDKFDGASSITATRTLTTGSTTNHFTIELSYTSAPTVTATGLTFASGAAYTSLAPLLTVAFTNAQKVVQNGLPSGLVLDEATGKVTGSVTVSKLTTYYIQFCASNNIDITCTAVTLTVEP